jgi:hypothetical protein
VGVVAAMVVVGGWMRQRKGGAIEVVERSVGLAMDVVAI